jgi:hypothetical protein
MWHLPTTQRRLLSGVDIFIRQCSNTIKQQWLMVVCSANGRCKLLHIG